MSTKSDPLIFSETNGAVTTESIPVTTHEIDASFDTVSATGSTENDTNLASMKIPLKSKTPHQAHGAVIRGPISTVQQLIGRTSVAKGSMGSFGTLEDYRDHIDTLTLGELHAHAIESMETPIYDTPVLKTRLERKWTEVVSRTTPGRGVGQARQNAGGYTPEQNAKAQALLKKMQRR